MQRTLLLAIVLATLLVTIHVHAQSPATTRNDDSCDISVAPAATLLLPYFEVDTRSPVATARTTLFTIVNTSPRTQIAKITLWTDWAYPALTFNYAGGNPLVHIRAIPEGGQVGSNIDTNLPYTFYDRYTTVGGLYPRTVDRRQPLPSTFAARWIQGGTSGFNADFITWREGYAGANAPPGRYVDNSAIAVTELVRFDEHENTNSIPPPPIILPVPGTIPVLPAASSLSTSSTFFPGLSPSGDLGGWMFINISNYGSPAYSAAVGRDFKSNNLSYARQSQNWVVVYMHAQGRFGVLFDATPLGNGCSKSPPALTTIGPAPNVTP